MKPHIKFKAGQWEMSGWEGDEGYPMLAISRASLHESLLYFASILPAMSFFLSRNFTIVKVARRKTAASKPT